MDCSGQEQAGEKWIIPIGILQVKGLLKDRKVEMLVDPDLNAYQETEVENLIQVALLCTQGSPLDRPKMSEVVRMLEGDGLAERWDEWQKVEVVRQEAESAPLRNDWIVDSTYNLRAVELSGPRWQPDRAIGHSTTPKEEFRHLIGRFGLIAACVYERVAFGIVSDNLNGRYYFWIPH